MSILTTGLSSKIFEFPSDASKDRSNELRVCNELEVKRIRWVTFAYQDVFVLASRPALAAVRRRHRSDTKIR